MHKIPTTFPPPRNPDDLGRGPAIMGVTWTFTTLAITATATRMWLRARTNKLYWDDWIMVVSTLLQLASQICGTVGFHEGLGKHDADLQLPDQYVAILKWNWISITPGILVSILARVSITILLVRLFGTHWWLKWTLVGLTALNSVLHSLILIFAWATPKPTEALWNIFLPNAKRWDHRVIPYMMFAAQSTCTVTDVAYVVLPVSIVWRLNMTTSRRIGLILLLCLSMCTAVISAIKTVSVRDLVHLEKKDPQYRQSLLLMWAVMEQSLLIFLGSVPPLYPCFKNSLILTKIRSFISSASALFRSSGTFSSKRGRHRKSQSDAAAMGPSHRYGDLERSEPQDTAKYFGNNEINATENTAAIQLTPWENQPSCVCREARRADTSVATCDCDDRNRSKVVT